MQGCREAYRQVHAVETEWRCSKCNTGNEVRETGTTLKNWGVQRCRCCRYERMREKEEVLEDHLRRMQPYETFLRDGALSELVKMGFSDKVANEALDATASNGQYSTVEAMEWMFANESNVEKREQEDGDRQKAEGLAAEMDDEEVRAKKTQEESDARLARRIEEQTDESDDDKFFLTASSNSSSLRPPSSETTTVLDAAARVSAPPSDPDVRDDLREEKQEWRAGVADSAGEDPRAAAHTNKRKASAMLDSMHDVIEVIDCSSDGTSKSPEVTLLMESSDDNDVTMVGVNLAPHGLPKGGPHATSGRLISSMAPPDTGTNKNPVVLDSR